MTRLLRLTTEAGRMRARQSEQTYTEPQQNPN